MAQGAAGFGGFPHFDALMGGLVAREDDVAGPPSRLELRLLPL
jgi:hypothetical protein